MQCTHPFYLTNIKDSNYAVYTPILLNKHKTQQSCSVHRPILLNKHKTHQLCSVHAPILLNLSSDW